MYGLGKADGEQEQEEVGCTSWGVRMFCCLSREWVVSADHLAARAKLAAAYYRIDRQGGMHELIESSPSRTGSLHAGNSDGLADIQRQCSDKEQASVACIRARQVLFTIK